MIKAWDFRIIAGGIVGLNADSLENMTQVIVEDVLLNIKEKQFEHNFQGLNGKVDLCIYFDGIKITDKKTRTQYIFKIEERHKISSMNLYQKVKNHIGKKIDLEIEVTYYFDKNGKRIDKKEEFTKPIKVLNIYGEEQVYEESIKNIEVHRHTTVVPIPFYN